jgi:uncharacterized protein YneF (UPF0154 family)
MTFRKKSFIIWVCVALIIGLVLGYFVPHRGFDENELEQQICQLEGELNALRAQIGDKNEQIAELQAQIEELEAVAHFVERIIEIEADGEDLHYQEIHFWSREEFLKIIGNQNEFESSQLVQFYETYNVNADNFKIEYNQKEGSTILKCDIHDTFSGSWYDFHWFLNPMGLDFIKSGFVKSENVLSWEGKVDGITITITLRFPFTISHCHAHVW